MKGFYHQEHKSMFSLQYVRKSEINIVFQCFDERIKVQEQQHIIYVTHSPRSSMAELDGPYGAL